MTACMAERAAAKAADVTAKTARDGSRMSRGSKERDGGLSYSSIMDQNPMLSANEQTELLKKKGTPEWPAAKERLVLGNLRLVTSIAKKYAWMEGCSFDDIMSHGVIGLMKAIDRYDPAAGARLSTYGTKWIQQEIRDELLYKKGQIRNPAYMEKLAARFKKCEAEMLQEGIRSPTVEMFAERMGLPEKKIRQIQALCEMDLVSIDTPASTGSDTLLVGDTISSSGSVEDEAVDKITLRDVAQAIRKLKPVEQKVIMMRFGFVGGRPMTLEECAAETGYSVEWCRRIQEDAIGKLQADYRDRKKR